MEKGMKNTKKFNQKSILPIVLYVVTGLIAIYAIFTMYLSYDYIVSLVDAGTISISDQLSDVIAYCVNASIAPVFYAIATWAIGYGVAKLNKIETLLKPNEEEVIIEK